MQTSYYIVLSHTLSEKQRALIYYITIMCRKHFSVCASLNVHSIVCRRINTSCKFDGSNKWLKSVLKLDFLNLTWRYYIFNADMWLTQISSYLFEMSSIKRCENFLNNFWCQYFIILWTTYSLSNHLFLNPNLLNQGLDTLFKYLHLSKPITNYLWNLSIC